MVVLVAALYIGYPLVMAFSAVAPDDGSDGEPPDDFAPITVTTADGLNLGAWYAEPTNGAAIILVHSAGGGRDSTRAYAQMLHGQGFGVLALSMSGFGDSEGRINRLGWRGTRDVGAAVAYLQGRENVRAIGALGLSMGREILLGAASSYPPLRAIAVDGATFRAVNEYIALPMNQPLYRNFTHHVFSFMVGLLTGDSQPQPTLLESIQAADATSFLFMAAGENDAEIAFNTFYRDSVPERSSLWIIPGVGHVGGFGRYPADYEQRVVEFFEAQLLVAPANVPG
jgi:hypothetical protein